MHSFVYFIEDANVFCLFSLVIISSQFILIFSAFPFNSFSAKTDRHPILVFMCCISMLSSLCGLNVEHFLDS